MDARRGWDWAFGFGATALGIVLLALAYGRLLPAPAPRVAAELAAVAVRVAPPAAPAAKPSRAASRAISHVVVRPHTLRPRALHPLAARRARVARSAGSGEVARPRVGRATPVRRPVPRVIVAALRPPRPRHVYGVVRVHLRPRPSATARPPHGFAAQPQMIVVQPIETDAPQYDAIEIRRRR